MLRTGDPASATGERTVSLDGTTAGTVRLPEGFSLFSAGYARDGMDLLATGPDGSAVVISGFFAAAKPPSLSSPDGARISGELIAGIARPEAATDLAQALFGPQPTPVAVVETVDAPLIVTRIDGARVELGPGDGIYPGDVVETGPNATAAIALPDGTVFGVGPQSRLIVGAVAPGSDAPTELAVDGGTYAFACAPTARPLVVDTPAGRIDADGARLVLSYRSDGTLELVLLPDEDGSVGNLVVDNGEGVVAVDRPFQIVTINDFGVPEVRGTVGVDELLASYGSVFGALPAGCGVAPAAPAEDASTGPFDDLGVAALEAMVEFETGAGGDDPRDAAAPAERIVVTQADPLSGSPQPAGAVAPPPPVASPPGLPTSGGTGADGPDTSNEPFLLSLAGRQSPPRPTFPAPPTAEPPAAVTLSVSDWSIPTWTTLVPRSPTQRAQQDLYRVVDGGYDEPEPFVSMPLPGQVVRTFAPSDGSAMVLMAAGPMNGPLETGRGVEIQHVEDPNRLGLPLGTLAREIPGADPIDGAAMWAVRTLAAGTTVRFDWMFDGRDEASFDDFAAFTVAVSGGGQTSVYELARNADVGGFGATGWRTSQWTFQPADGAPRTLKLGFVVMNHGDDANEPRLLIDNVRVNSPVQGDVQPLGDPQVDTLGTLATYGPVPTASDDAVTTVEDSALTIAAGTLLANDTSPTGVQSLSVVAVAATASTVGRVTRAGDGSITYDPAGRFDHLGTGASATDTFAYTIRDINGATGTAVVTVTILGVNDAPTARDDVVSTSEKAAVTVVPTANDIDPEGRALIVSALDFTGTVGSVTLNADGTVAYDPAGRFQRLRAGENAIDRFTYTIGDGDGGTAAGRVTITVIGVNDAPTANPDSVSAGEDAAVTIAVTGNDGDPEGRPLTITGIDTGTAIGRVTITGSGTLSYDPIGRFNALAVGEQAIDTFTYTISDGDGGTATATATVTVTVLGANDRPTAVDDALAVDEDGAIAIDGGVLLANDSDPDATDALTVTAVDGTATLGTVGLGDDGSITYDPGDRFNALRAGETATDRFAYSISDGHGGTATATATVTITGVNDAPVAQNDAASTDEHSSLRIAARRLLGNDIDPDDGETLRLRVVDVDATETAGTAVLNVDGSVTYDPAGRFADLAFGETATDTFTYTIADDSGTTASATVTVTIAGRNEASTPGGELIASFEETGASTLPPEWDRVQSARPGPQTFEPVSVVSRYDETDGARGAFAPTDGGRMAVLEAFGSFADPVTSIADFLGMSGSALPRDVDGSDAKDGAAMKTTVLVKAGDEISFDWMFDARDVAGADNQAFNDFALFNVSGSGIPQVFKLSDVRAIGGLGASGWRTSKFLATADGEVTLGFAVMNDEAAHGLGNARNSRLLVDNVRVNRELDDDFQLLAGQPGGVFQTWVQPPTAGGDAVAVAEDAALIIAPADLLANDAPPAVGGTIALLDVDAALSSGAVRRNADGNIAYDPRGRFDHLVAGETATDAFLYTIAASNGGTAVGRVEVTVTGVNDAPDAVDDRLAGDEDTGVSGNVLADNGDGGDRDAEGDAFVVTRVNGAAAVGSQIALASGALLIVNADGSFVYDPAGRFAALRLGETATDGFTYTVDDGHGGTDTATVTFVIAGVNDRPTAVADAASTSEDAPVTLTPSANDADPEGDPLFVSAIDAGGTLGTVTLAVDGTVRYDPRGKFDSLAAGETATDSFAYVVVDGAGGTDVGTATVRVTGLNDVPIASLDVATTDENTPVTVDVLANDFDVDNGDTLTVAAVGTGATIGSVTVEADGTITYDPAGRFGSLRADETATDNFTYTVADGHGATATTTVSVTVVGVAGGPSSPGELVESFETPPAANDTRGLVLRAAQYNEPDGTREQYLPTDGSGMAFLEATGASATQIAFFLGLPQSLPSDSDNSLPTDGAALRLTVGVRAGDEISFDWMFDANDIVTPPSGDFDRAGLNDFAVFAADGQLFRLSDVRQTFNETGIQRGASGWRSSVYTAPSDGPLTIGFAVVNDANFNFDSHLLVDNVRLNRTFGEGYQVVDTQAGGQFETLVQV